MKSILRLLGVLVVVSVRPAFACDIVDKRDIDEVGRIGVAGSCSNNGEKIECYDAGAYYGGLTCDGPLGTNSAYNLKDLIYAVCGCTPKDQEDIDEQLNRERE